MKTNTVALKPYSFTELAKLYDVCIRTMKKWMVPFEEEVLTESQQLNEYIMTGLRTIEGISLNKIARDWGEQKKAVLIDAAQKHFRLGHLLQVNDVLRLSKDGKFLADGIASDLFQL